MDLANFFGMGAGRGEKRHLKGPTTDIDEAIAEAVTDNDPLPISKQFLAF